MRILLMISLLSITSFWLKAQQNDNNPACINQLTPAMAELLENTQPEVEAHIRDFNNGGQARVVKNIPVRVHVIRTSSGTGGVSVTQVNTAMANLNDLYAPVEFNFFLCGNINYIDNTTYYNFTVNEEDAFLQDYGQDGVIDIIIPGGEVLAPEGFTICGYAPFPWLLDDDYVVVAASCFLPDNNTLAHEIGHFMGLLHTHETATGVELVNGANCNSAGDFLCGTPADPSLSELVNVNCQYIGTAVDPNGQVYAPMVSNIMSYARQVCRFELTSDQYGVIDYYYNQYHTNLSCPEPCTSPGLYDFRASPINANEAVLNCFIENAEAYVWAIRELDAEDWFISDALPNQATNFTGLSPNTIYEYSVLLNCGNEDSDWSPIKTFRTAIVANAPVLSMWDPIVVNADPVVSGDPLTLNFNVANYGLDDFAGTISLDLYSEDFDYLEELGALETSLCANCYLTDGINFVSSVDYSAGIYYIIAWYQESGEDWQEVNDDVHSNIIQIEVIENTTPELTVNPTTVSLSSSADNQSISISGNVNWTITTGTSSWLSTSTTSGTGNGSFILSATPNNTCSSRSGTMTVSGGGLSRNIQVTQLGQTANLALGVSILDFMATGGIQPLSITSNVDWTASSGATWLSTNMTSGTGNSTLNLTATSNPTSTFRQTTLTVTTMACGGITRTLIVTQTGSGISIPWTVTETEDNHTVIIPTTAPLLVDDMPLQIGDAIGFFYTHSGQEFCSNYVIWTGENTSLAVYGNDAESPAKNGFGDGEVLRAKVYQAATEEIFNAQLSFVQIGEHPLVTHTNTYADDGISMLAGLEANGEQVMTIDLNQGWNMVSSYLDPTEPDMLQLLNGIQDDVLLLKDAEGNTVIPSFSINNIGDWNLRKGYKVKMSQAAELEIYGAPINPAEEPIELLNGWQIIAYLRDNPQNVATAFNEISDQIEIVKNNSGQTYIPAFNINTLGSLQPTQGYKVKANQNTTLLYNSIAPPDSEQRRVVPTITELQHFLLDSAFNTGNNAVIVFPRENLPSWIEVGDEIGVFNEQGFLAGAVVVAENNFALTVWGDDQDTPETDGLQSGERYRLVWWSSLMVIETDLQLEMETGDGLYGEDDVEVVASLAVVSSIERTPKTLGLSVFPNPATQRLTVSTSTAIKGIVVYDANGRELLYDTSHSTSLVRELDIANWSPGLYWLSAWDGERWAYHRFIKQ